MDIKKVEAFLTEYKELCYKYGMALRHEDTHGGFGVSEKNIESSINWVMELLMEFDKYGNFDK